MGTVSIDLGDYDNRAVIYLRNIAREDLAFDGGPSPRAKLVNLIADQIEAQTKPPRIPEPGLWGVVEAMGASRQDGALSLARWVRVDDGGTWRRPDNGFGVGWHELTNPVLIRAGVES